MSDLVRNHINRFSRDAAQMLVSVFREIDALRDHPFKTIPRQLTDMFAKEGKIAASICNKTACLSTDAKIYSISDMLTYDSGNNEESLIQNDHCNESANRNSDISNHQYRLQKTSCMKVDSPDKSLAKTLETLRVPDPLCKYDSKYDNLSLRASLLDSFKSVGCFHIESGPVFRSCLIQTGHLPIQYQMLIVWQASTLENTIESITTEHQINGTENKEVTGDDKETMVGNEKPENHNAETDEDCEIDGNVHTNLEENKAVFAVHIVEKTIHNLKKVLGDHCNIEFYNQCKYKDRSEVLYANKGVKSLGYFVIEYDDKELNSIPLGELVQLDENRKPEYSGHSALILFLDDIVSVLFNIKDKRLLYSLDNRFTDQLLNSDSVDGCMGCEIKIPSLYPMTFVHDMSFWENERLEFDEMAFCDIIRNIADDSVFSVELIDKYKDPETGRFSRCYRMTFQSLDKALCYATSWKLQSLIRLEVEKHLEIYLR